MDWIWGEFFCGVYDFFLFNEWREIWVWMMLRCLLLLFFGLD